MTTKVDVLKSDLLSAPKAPAQTIVVYIILAFTLIPLSLGQTPTEQQVFSLILQARQYTAHGNLEKALEVGRRALALAEIIGPSNSRTIALAANNLGVIYRRTGQYKNAEAAYKRACEIFSTIPELITGEGSCRDNLGLLYDEMGRFKESEIQQKTALSIFKKVSPESLDTATVLANLGNLYEHEADYSQSISYFDNARSMLENLPS